MSGAGWNTPTLLWVVTASVAAAGLFIWPLHIVLTAGQNADLALVAAVAWGSLVALLHPPRARGATMGWIRLALQTLDAAALVVVCAVDTVMLNQLASLLQSMFYYESPRSALVLPLVVVVGLVVNRAPESAWRVTTFFVPMLLVLSLGIFLLATANLHYTRPIFPTSHIVLTPIVHALGVVAYVGVPLGVTLRRAGARLADPPGWRWRLGAVALPAGFLGALYVLTMGALGPAALIQIRWPVVFVLDHVTLDSTFFLSRIGLVVVFSWTLGVALGLIVHLRMVLTLMPVRPRVRWVGSGTILAIWAITALRLPSPVASSDLLLRWMDPLAAWYLVSELLVLLVARIAIAVDASRGNHTTYPASKERAKKGS